MIKPINSVSPTTKGYNKFVPKYVQVEKLQNLIKEFEECAKKQPENLVLKNHIENLKKHLQELTSKL